MRLRTRMRSACGEQTQEYTPSNAAAARNFINEQARWSLLRLY
jgi:hypothetical protein